MRTRLIAALAAASLIGGCSTSSYEPVVDFKSSKSTDAVKYQSDLTECRALADKQNPAMDAGKDALIGGAIGAALGAALGAATGSAGTGAMIGAAAGGIGGGAHGGIDSATRQRNIVRNCLRGRGYAVLD